MNGSELELYCFDCHIHVQMKRVASHVCRGNFGIYQRSV